MSPVVAGYRVEKVDLDGADDETVRPFVELNWHAEREVIPEDPKRPFAAIAQRLRTSSPLFERWRWAAWAAEGRLAGQAVMSRSTKDNQHLRDVNLYVEPEHRGRGLGRSLLAHAFDAMGAGEGLLVQGWTSDRIPKARAFAERLGAKPGLRMRVSQLELSKVDRMLMREWASIDPPGYRLFWIDGDTPDELMDNVVAAARTMNTMPREDLDVEDWTITPETIRERERLSRDRGQERRLLLAIDESTGESAGFTEIAFDPRVPSVLHQEGTAVVPAHRGKGIGKWVKARMVERVLAEMPEARYIRTENAGTNAAMLAINVGMGFVPAWEAVIWQVPVPDARRALESAAR